MMKILAAASTPIKLYELERQRSNITPKEFYWICRTDLRRKFNVDLENWVEYSEWINPSYPEELHKVEHKDTNGSQLESYKFQPYDIQLFLQNTYNFIMQFEFDTDKKGFGYMYVVEYQQ